MKKTILIFLGLLFTYGLFSQTIVSTTVQKRKVVLEEYTGIYCTWCPEGHEIAYNLATANPGNFFAINYHYGGYAAPSGSDPDYRTPDGDIIGGFFGPTGFPMGQISRHDFGAGIVTGRGDWTANTNTVKNEDSYVNVGVEATYNSTTKLLTVHVEAYYTGNSPAPTNYLSVALLQSNIIGPQTGGSGNPYGYISATQYRHAHMFRDMINPVWGDAISTTTTGTFVNKYYYYLVPTSFNGVAVVPGDLEIVAMVHETEAELESANGCVPTITSTVPTLDAVLTSVTTPETVCGDLSPVATILNNGSTTLTSVGFSYNVNGGTPQTYTWTGSLTTGQSANVTLPVISFTPITTNTCNVSITTVNGGADGVTTNNTGNASFAAAITGTTTVYLELMTDNYGTETTWNLKNSAGTTLYSGGPYTNAQVTYNQTWTLAADCYTFTINDAYGDGMCCSYGNGYFTIDDSNSTLLGSGGQFGSSDQVVFRVASAAPPVTNFTASATSVCAGSTITFTDNSTNSPTSWSWNFNGGATNSTVQNPTVTFNTPGTYTIALTATNGAGSNTNTKTNYITVYANPTASSSAAAVACFGGTTGTATVTPSGGTSPYTYLWSNGGTSASITGLAAATYNVTVTDSHNCKAYASSVVTQPATAVNGSITSSTNVSCYGLTNGSATAAGSGGTSPYTYTWSSGALVATATGLASGTYTVTIRDANLCTITRTVTITQPTALNASTSTTAANCFGQSNGTATVTASGGSPTYTYLWTGGATTAAATGLAAGTYTVTVTDSHNCTTTTTATVSQPTAVSGSHTSTNVICNGGSTGTASVSATGGTPSYTYSWNTGSTSASISGLIAGTYTATITDTHGCTDTESVTITQPSALVASTTVVNVSCFGSCNGSVTGGATGGGGTLITYSWSNGSVNPVISGLCAGTYTLTVTNDLGCQDTETATVTSPTAIVVTPSVTNATCGTANGSATVSVSGGSSPYTYSWSTGSTTTGITGVVSGTYYVTVTDSHSCQQIQTVNISDVGGATVTTNFTPVSCFGGSNGTASVSATGGTSPYSYNWSAGGSGTSVAGLAAGTYTVTVTDNSGCVSTQTVTVTQPTVVSGSISAVNASCNGLCDGSLSVTASGGTPGYSYLWTGGSTGTSATALCAGSYTVTITDNNGCAQPFSGTVTQPSTISSSTTSTTNVLCNGGNNGAATVAASGGTAPYTYDWSSGTNGASASGLEAGTYTVTITDGNDCEINTTVVITEPAVIDITSSVSQSNCGMSDGSAIVSVTGGVMPFDYNWSNGSTADNITGVPSGSYTVTVTDNNGCEMIEVVGITDAGGPSLTGVSENILCFGENNGSASVTATGGAGPYSYEWTGGETTSSITGLGAGNYDVTVTDDNGCISIETFTISQPPAISIDITSDIGTATATASGGTGSFTYEWSNGATSATISGLAEGNYTVTVTDENGCTESESVYVTGVGISEVQEISLNIFPNPAEDILNIIMTGAEIKKVIVNDQLGRTLMVKDIINNETRIDLSNCTPGMYYITVTNENKNYIRKIVIK